MNPFIFRIAFIFIIFLMPVIIYQINPFNLETNNIRPRLFGHDMYKIPSRSMKPALLPGDIILASFISPHDSFPQKGQIVVFMFGDKKTLFIKRIIALEGDTVEIVAGVAKVNGERLNEAYVNKENTLSAYSKTMRLIKIPRGMVFVMGDNRDNSNDSRRYGAIPATSVIAKATKLLFGKKGRSGQTLLSDPQQR